MDDCALNFIKEKGIEYVIVEKYAKTPEFLTLNSTLLFEYDGNKIFKMKLLQLN